MRGTQAQPQCPGKMQPALRRKKGRGSSAWQWWAAVLSDKSWPFRALPDPEAKPTTSGNYGCATDPTTEQGIPSGESSGQSTLPWSSGGALVKSLELSSGGLR